MSETRTCPFIVGQTVIYSPSQRGIDSDVMSSDEEKLTPGKAYRIAEIKDNTYVVPDGYNHPGGGIYWTEFTER